MENTTNTATTTAAEEVARAATTLADRLNCSFETAVRLFLNEVASVDPVRFARLLAGLNAEATARAGA